MRLLIVFTVALALSGCAPILFDRSRPDSPNLIVVPQPGAVLAPLTRGEVRAQFGDPLLIGANDEYYVYRRLAGDKRWTLLWVFPYIFVPARDNANFQQIVGIWFDASGRAEKMVEDSNICVWCRADVYRPVPKSEVARIDKWMRDQRPKGPQSGSGEARQVAAEATVAAEALPPRQAAVPTEAAALPADSAPVPQVGTPTLVVPGATPTVRAFGFGFGISPTQFLTENPHFDCRDESERFRWAGDQSCSLLDSGARQSCSRLGDLSTACYQSFREALNFFGIVPADEIASGAGLRAMAKIRTASFFDGRLGALSWLLDGSTLPDVTRALQARYGPPLSDTTTGDAPVGAESSSTRTIVWKDTGVTLTVELHPTHNIFAPSGRCEVWIRTDAYETEFAKRRAAMKEKAAVAN